MPDCRGASERGWWRRREVVGKGQRSSRRRLVLGLSRDASSSSSSLGAAGADLLPALSVDGSDVWCLHRRHFMSRLRRARWCPVQVCKSDTCYGAQDGLPMHQRETMHRHRSRFLAHRRMGRPSKLPPSSPPTPSPSQPGAFPLLTAQTRKYTQTRPLYSGGPAGSRRSSRFHSLEHRFVLVSRASFGGAHPPPQAAGGSPPFFEPSTDDPTHPVSQRARGRPSTDAAAVSLVGVVRGRAHGSVSTGAKCLVDLHAVSFTPVLPPTPSIVTLPIAPLPSLTSPCFAVSYGLLTLNLSV